MFEHEIDSQIQISSKFDQNSKKYWIFTKLVQCNENVSYLINGWVGIDI